MPNAYAIGTLVTLTGTFRSLAGALTSPSSVVCRVRAPDGTETTPTTTQSSTGVYTATVTPTQAGDWHYRFEGSGAVEVSGETYFVVRQSVFAAPA